MRLGRRDARGASELERSIRAVADEPRLTVALRLSEDLRAIASRSRDPHRDARRLADVVRDGDDLTALAALHALGTLADPVADRVLLDLVLQGDEPFAAHAAWALAARGSSPEAIAGLIGLIPGGGFTAMLAERTLVEWSRLDQGPTRAAVRLATELADGVDSIRLGELLAALPRPVSNPASAAVASGLGEDHDGGIVVIQPFLHARLDRSGSSLGAGDAGGIASLLRSLGSALTHVDEVSEVITVTRRHATLDEVRDGVLEPRSEQLSPGHRVVRLDIGPTGPLPWREAWSHRAEIERKLILLGESFIGRRVVWHLRMADVGTLAASAAARRLGQPVVFTAAPDPHIVIDALQDDGRLHRDRFAVEEAAAQFWFRARMVERLSAQADRLALLPRPTIEREMVDLIGIEPADLAERAVIVPEGVDLAEIDRARRHLVTNGASPAVTRILDGLPPHRRCLPWLLTVGRLHTAKGAHRIVEAMAGDPVLAASTNVVIVGGDLGSPSPDEQSAIERVRRAAVAAPEGSVVLAGHRPPAVVADLLAFVGGQGGVYVCASDKEEFGLAIVEAMGAGAAVVAPARGGPRAYIEDGVTGVLCDTLSTDSLREAIGAALILAQDDDRAAKAIAMVRADLSVQRMADRLGEIYRELLPQPVNA